MGECLQHLATQETSSIGRHWCLTRAEILKGHIRPPSPSNAFSDLSPEATLQLLSTKLMPEKAQNVVQRVGVQLDEGQMLDFEVNREPLRLANLWHFLFHYRLGTAFSTSAESTSFPTT